VGHILTNRIGSRVVDLHFGGKKEEQNMYTQDLRKRSSLRRAHGAV
jgi:hypothetical protein